MINEILLLLSSIVRCAVSSSDDASLITMILFQTGGNVGWFASWHQVSKNPERNRFKDPFPIGGKGVPVGQTKESVWI